MKPSKKGHPRNELLSLHKLVCLTFYGERGKKKYCERVNKLGKETLNEKTKSLYLKKVKLK